LGWVPGKWWGHVGGGSRDAAHLGGEVGVLAAGGDDAGGGLILVEVEGRRLWAAADLGEPPVDHAHLAEDADHQVLRLEVAVGDALVMGVADGVGGGGEGGEQAP